MDALQQQRLHHLVEKVIESPRRMATRRFVLLCLGGLMAVQFAAAYALSLI